MWASASNRDFTHAKQAPGTELYSQPQTGDLRDCGGCGEGKRMGGGGESSVEAVSDHLTRVVPGTAVDLRDGEKQEDLRTSRKLNNQKVDVVEG